MVCFYRNWLTLPAGFLLDYALGPLDEIVGTFTSAIDLLHRGVSFVLTNSGLVEARDPGALHAGSALLAIYSSARRPAAVYEGHHLNQYAAFEPAFSDKGYSRSNGAMIDLEGSTRIPGSEHYRVHQYLEENLWKKWRPTDKNPPLEEYNRVLFEAITQVRGRSAAEFALKFARAEQKDLGLGTGDLVPNVPYRRTKR